MSDLTTLYRQLDALRVTRRQAVEDHEKALRGFDREMTRIVEEISNKSVGLDVDAIERGRAVLSIKGNVTDVRHGVRADERRSHVRPGAIDSAKIDLARDGAAKLTTNYIGVKNYGGFGDQREDHRYNMGPRHGSIVFRIALQEDVRTRLREGGSLASQEIEDALYLLTVLPTMEKAQKSEEVA